MKHTETIYHPITRSSASHSMRGVLLTITAFLSMFCVLMNADTAHAVSLKTSTTINDDVIKLGDVFDGVEEKSNTVLGASPKPGAEMILSARTLMRIASAHNINWKPSSVADQAVLRRTAHTIGTDEITETLHQAIAEKGVNGKFSIILNNPDASITMGGNQIPSVEILSLNVVPTRNVFEAILVAPSKENPAQKINLSGQIQQMLEVPVLRDSMKFGDIIGTADINWIDVPEKTVGNDVVLDADDLIGKTPSRVLLAGKTIRIRDVSAPKLVDRGDEITIQYMEGPIQLSIKGKALQNGAMGDIIRVMNTNSNKSVMAEVTEHKVVSVQ